MNIAISQLLSQVSQELKALEIARQRYAKQLSPDFSVFNYIYTDEMMLSRIIADLLNPTGEHAQGTVFLSLFLKTLDLPDDWKNIDLDHANITVQTEKIIRNGRRMDIFINIKLDQRSYGICIENKPFAADGEQQLQDYADEMYFLFSESWHLIYLSGYGNEPAEHSVKPDILKSWLDQKHFSQITFPDLIYWLKQSLTECQNDKVIFFLKQFHNYILKTFSGVKDMSTQETIFDCILDNDSSLIAAIEIANQIPMIKRKLIEICLNDLINKAKELDWQIKDYDFHNSKAFSGFEILNSLEINKEDYHIGLEFQKTNYGMPIFGIWKGNTNKSAVLNSQIFEILSKKLPYNIKSSQYWVFYIVLEEINWTDIRNGKFNDKIIDYTLQIKKALENINTEEASA